MYKKIVTILLIGFALILSLGACSNPTTSNVENAVHMSNNDFVRSSISINKGESITLIADTFSVHKIANGTWEDGQAKAGKEEGAPNATVQVDGGQSATIGPFNTAGTFEIYCINHTGMELSVIVK